MTRGAWATVAAALLLAGGASVAGTGPAAPAEPGPEVLPSTSFLDVEAYVGGFPLCVGPICTPFNVFQQAVWKVRACSSVVAVLEWAGGSANGGMSQDVVVLNGPPELPNAVGSCFSSADSATFLFVNCAYAEAALVPVGQLPLADHDEECGAF